MTVHTGAEGDEMGLIEHDDADKRPGQRYSAWFTNYPSTHERAGRTVEVVTRETFDALAQQHAGAVADIERDLLSDVDMWRGRFEDAASRETGLHEALRRETEEVERLRSQLAGAVSLLDDLADVLADDVYGGQS